MVSGPEVADEEITVPTLEGTLPALLVEGAVVSADGGVRAVLYQVAVAPPTVRVRGDVPVNPTPLVIEMVAPALAEDGDNAMEGETVKYTVAGWLSVPDTVIVCVPAVAVDGSVADRRSIAPLVLKLVKPVDVVNTKLVVLMSNVTVMASPCLKPDPVIATVLDEPTMFLSVPDAGVTVIEDAVMVKVVVATFIGVVAESVTTMVCEPA